MSDEYAQYIVLDLECDSTVGTGGNTQADALAKAEQQLDEDGDPDSGFVLGLYKLVDLFEPQPSKIKLRKVQ